jgi:hypothetical protein
MPIETGLLVGSLLHVGAVEHRLIKTSICSLLSSIAIIRLDCVVIPTLPLRLRETVVTCYDRVITLPTQHLPDLAIVIVTPTLP